MSISFQNADVRFSFKQKKAVAAFIEQQLSTKRSVVGVQNFEALRQPATREIQLTYIFCSDDFLLDINHKFLNHDYYTDIITFPLTNTKQFLEAEIYISIDRVKENALELGVKKEDELLRVIFHGVLHLLGHKDKNKVQKTEMRKLEENWIKRYKKAIITY